MLYYGHIVTCRFGDECLYIIANTRVVLIVCILLGINILTFCMFIIFFPADSERVGTCNAEVRDFFFFVVFILQTIIFSRFIKFTRCLKALKIFKALPLNSTTITSRRRTFVVTKKIYLQFIFLIHELHFIQVISNVRDHAIWSTI